MASPSPKLAEHTAPGLVLAGRYRLDRPIAADLWEGVDIVLSRPVAIRIGPQRTSGTSRFAHPGVVTLFDAGVDNGRGFTVLELVRGETLAARLVKGTDVEAAVSMGIEIARVLGAGHAQGVAHGALDGHAVLLTRAGRVKLTPFRVPAAHDEDVEADVWAAADLVAQAAGTQAPPELRLALQRARDAPDALRMAEALGELGIVDDAIDLAALDPTPPSGTPAPRRARPSAVPGLIVLVLVAAAALVAFTLARAPHDPRTPDGSGRGGGPVAIASATSFDPLGDGSEHEEQAPLAIDGRPDTSWTTSRYTTRALGGLKPGVGLVLELEEAVAMTALEVRGSSTGWKARIYVADAPARDLAGWGEPVSTIDNGSSAQVFPLEGRRGRAVLIWITDLGDGQPPLRFSIAEAILTR